MVRGVIGQFRATRCPVCDSPDNGKWTCPSCTRIVEVHRELIRNLQHWESLLEAQEVPAVLVASDSRSYSIWDVQRFYGFRVQLPGRMRQSIQYYLYENMLECDAAVRMGIRPTNPVGTYATIGLTNLIGKAVSGELPGYYLDLYEPQLEASGV